MNVYLLTYTDECGCDIEQEFEAWSDKLAVDEAYRRICGSEGLFSHPGLYGANGEELLPADECWF